MGIKMEGKSNFAEVSLRIDTYDDIFSDFDPRPYSERRLSDDFLYELRRAIAYKPSENIKLKILVPKDERNLSIEDQIKKRVEDYFNMHVVYTKKELDKFHINGLKFIIMGVLLMFVASYFLLAYPPKDFIVNFLIFLLEPASWFLFWEGLRMVVFESKRKIKKFEFYKKMSNSEIEFLEY